MNCIGVRMSDLGIRSGWTRKRRLPLSVTGRRHALRHVFDGFGRFYVQVIIDPLLLRRRRSSPHLVFICVTSRAACPPYMYPQCVQREGCFLLQGRSKLSKKMRRRPARLLIELIDWAMEERNPVAAEAFFPAFPLAKWCNNVPKWLHIRNGNVCTQCVQLQWRKSN